MQLITYDAWAALPPSRGKLRFSPWFTNPESLIAIVSKKGDWPRLQRFVTGTASTLVPLGDESSVLPTQLVKSELTNARA